MMMKRRFKGIGGAFNHREFGMRHPDDLPSEVSVKRNGRLFKIAKNRREAVKRKSFRLNLTAVLILVAFLMQGSFKSEAQVVTNPFAHPFSQLDSKHYPSGLLHNKSPYYLNSFLFDSVSLALVPNPFYLASPYAYSNGQVSFQPGVFLKIYKDMLMSRTHDSVIKPPNQYLVDLNYAKSTYQVPISIMAINFHRLDEGALNSRKVWFDTIAGVYLPMPDTLWYPESVTVNDTTYYPGNDCYDLYPFSDDLLATAFSEHYVYGSEVPDRFVSGTGTNCVVQFVFPSALFISNRTFSSGLLVDFDDGMGYRSVIWDTPINISYPSPAKRDFLDVEIKIKLIDYDPDLVIIQPMTISSEITDIHEVFFTSQLPFTCNIEASGEAAEAKVSVIYADENLRQIRKPVIFVEGFETEGAPYGAITLENIMMGKMDRVGFPELAEMPLLFDSLTELGYDIIYIDFLNSRDSLERNVLSVIKVIQWVNQELDNSQSDEMLVVAGASMGGVLARYALRLLEVNGCCHNTWLYVSFDAPHQGANIPLGMQHFVKVAADESSSWYAMSWPMSWIESLSGLEISLNNSESERSWHEVLNSPAARAMLIQHIDPSATQYHTSFYDMLEDLDYPENCRKIALINGNEDGIGLQLNDPDSRLIGTGTPLKLPEKWACLPTGNIVAVPMYYPLIFAKYVPAYSMAWSESKAVCFENNDWSGSLHGVNDILKRSGLHSGANIALGALGVSAIGFNPVLAAFCEAAMIANKIGGNARLKSVHEDAAIIDQILTNGALPLSIVPGGLNNSLKKLGEIGDGIVTTYSDEFSFVPSLSAIDIEGIGFTQSIKDAYMTNPYIAPFDAYWAPDRVPDGTQLDENQMHVQITEANRSWIIEQLSLGSPSKDIAVISSYYNFARCGIQPDIEYFNRPVHTIMHSMDVIAGGQLMVNHQGVIGNKKGNLMPKPGSNFRINVYNEDCNPARVSVYNGGVFVLGDASNGNSAIVNFKKGSSLELYSGSTLIINDKSTLVIDDEADVIIHPGVIINLVGDESVFEIRGRFRVRDNAEVSLLGDGILKFNYPQSTSSNGSGVQPGKNSKLIIEGKGKWHKRVEVLTDANIDFITVFDLKDAAIAINDMKSLHLNSVVMFDNIAVTSLDSNMFKFNSVVVYGRKSVFRNVDFSYGTVALEANLGFGGNALSIEKGIFRKNNVGLYSSDERVLLRECNFFDNALNGWVAENMAGKSTVDRCCFSGHGQAGINFSGQLSSSLMVFKSTFTNNNYGVRVSHSLLQSECSSFKLNSIAGIFCGEMGRVFFNEQARNVITQNLYGIAFDRALSVKLENSYTNFSGNQFFLVGELMPHGYYQGESSAITSVDISGNHLPVVGNIWPISLYFTDPVTLVLTQIPIICNTVVSSAWADCDKDDILNEHILAPLMAKTGATVINSGMYKNFFLIDALIDAASMVSCDGYFGNDTLAIFCFSEIFKYLSPQINEDEFSALDYSLQLMTTALGNAIEQGLIEPNRAIENMPLNEYVEMLRDQLLACIELVDSSDPYSEEHMARYMMMMAQMYRVAEHYDYALGVLGQHVNFSGTELSGSAAYWSCVCDAERALFSDSLEQGAFIELLDSCNALRNARLAPFIPYLWGSVPTSSLSEKGDLINVVYPIPANKALVVEFAAPVDNVVVELMDASGRSITAFHEYSSNKSIKLKLPYLSDGSYILKVFVGDRVFHRKIMIKQE